MIDTNDNQLLHQAIKAVVFDVYGTLVEIRDKRRPYRQLLEFGQRQGRPAQEADAELIMSSRLGLKGVAELLKIDLSSQQLSHLESEMRAETASIRLFPDTVRTLFELRELRTRVGLCSNLAAEYAAPVIAILPTKLEAYIWSFEVGHTKPSSAIYERACESLGCAAPDVLMVGDTLSADVEGPQAFGMQALLLDPRNRHSYPNSISSLLTVPRLVSSE